MKIKISLALLFISIYTFGTTNVELLNGWKELAKNNFSSVESHFRKAYELDENNLSVLLNYAGVLNDLGKTDEALSYLNRIQFNDFNPEVHEAIFNVYLKCLGRRSS